jgi:hypothetical protein
MIYPLKRLLTKGHRMKKRILAPVLLLACAVVAPQASAAFYSGSLEFFSPLDAANELVVQGGTETSGDTAGWAGGKANVLWEVTDADPLAPDGFPWKYTYTVSVFKKDISHVLLETSDSFTSDAITGFTSETGGVSLAGDSPTDYGNDGGNSPGIPESLFGLKIDGGTGRLWKFSFFSSRAPVWGDVYAVDGKSDAGDSLDPPPTEVDNYLYNAGFTFDDTDPNDAPADGSEANHYFYHILVPDTNGSPGPPVPEPSVMVGLVGMSIMGMGAVLLRRRRTR